MKSYEIIDTSWPRDEKSSSRIGIPNGSVITKNARFLMISVEANMRLLELTILKQRTQKLENNGKHQLQLIALPYTSDEHTT